MFARPRCAARTYQMCPSSSRRISVSMFIMLTTPAGSPVARSTTAKKSGSDEAALAVEPAPHLFEPVERTVGHVRPDRVVVG